MYKRHVIFWKIVRPLARIFLYFKFGYTCKMAKGLPDKYIVLSNHTTDYDPLLVASSFPKHMYFVASEHVVRWGYLSKLLMYWLAPIIRYKGTTATVTVMEMLRKVRDGANVAMFAEGARSWDGVTADFLPSTGKVIKSAKCGLVTYRIEGGYFTSPRWSTSNTRKGRLYGAPVNVYTREQLSNMSVDEINQIIARDLHEDAYGRQLEKPVRYKGKRLAENLENLLFICPMCGGIDSFHTHDNTVSCDKCQLTFRYTEYGMLEEAPFQTVYDFAKWQRREVEKAATEGCVYTAKHASLKKIENHVETIVDEGQVSFGEEKLVVGDTQIMVSDILDLSMHGRRGIVFSTKDTYYEMIPDEDTCAYKFHLLYETYKKNIER